MVPVDPAALDCQACLDLQADLLIQFLHLHQEDLFDLDHLSGLQYLEFLNHLLIPLAQLLLEVQPHLELQKHLLYLLVQRILLVLWDLDYHCLLWHLQCLVFLDFQLDLLAQYLLWDLMGLEGLVFQDHQ